MNIAVPFQLKPTGGTSSFAKKFKLGMEQRGHTVTFSLEKDSEVMLVIASTSLKNLLAAKLKKMPVIQRLDGIYYPESVFPKTWWLRNLPVRLTALFANQLIFQSKFSRVMCAKYLPFGLPPDKGAQGVRIYNGVDLYHFKPSGPAKELRDSPDQRVFITWSRFRRTDQIDPLIKIFKAYQQTHNAKLVIIGNFEGVVAKHPEKLKHEKNIDFLGTISNKDIPQYARGADAFIMTHKDPPCPNNVIEAMACGLPIIANQDGAMPELVTIGQQGELPHNINKIFSNLNSYSAAAHAQAEKYFSLEKMLDNYEQALEKTTSQNTRT